MLPPRALYRLFPRVARTSDRIERRLTQTGRLLLGIALASALFSIDIRQTFAYQIWTLALSLLLVAAATSLRWRPQLSVRRILPDCVTSGVAANYWLEVTNHGRTVERDLLLYDRLVEPSLSYQRFLGLRESDLEPSRNWFDRAVGFPRWVALQRRARGVVPGVTALPTLAPGASVRVGITTTCLRRGWIRYAAVDVLRPDPLGLVRACRRVPLAGALLALPRRHAVPALELRAERRYQRGGVSLASVVGDAQEFAGLRDYRPGDPRRHIHWRSYAKTGRLIVKEYHDEYFDRHALVVDTHIAARESRLFEGVISVAASIAARARPRDAILDLLVAGSEILELNAGRGLGDVTRALAFLAEAQYAESGDFSVVGGALRERASELASVVLVLGCYDPVRAAVVDSLRRRGLAVAAVCVVDSEALPSAAQTGTFYVRLQHLGEDLLRVSLRGRGA